MHDQSNISADKIASAKSDEDILADILFGAEVEPTYSVTIGDHLKQTDWTKTKTEPWTHYIKVFTSHHVGEKDGVCVVPALFRGGRRKKDDASRIDIVVLDSDCGHTLSEIEAALRAKGWRGIVHSTHSHLTTRLEVKKSNWDRWCAQTGCADAAQYMREKGYLPHVAEGARLVEGNADDITIEHAPCPKYRALMPLERPWLAADYPDQQTANDAWADAIGALAGALGLHHDQSCVDTSRLFFTPRYPGDPNRPPESSSLDGKPCDIWGLPLVAAKAKTTTTTGSRERSPADYGDTFDYLNPESGEVVDLEHWAAQYGKRFEIVTALKSRAAGRFTGKVVDGVKWHIECPNSCEHTSTAADEATFVTNASEARNAGFVTFCQHGHCRDRDRLLFVRRMLDEEWLTIEDLTDPAFLVPSDEDEDEEPKPSFDQCVTAANALTLTAGPDDIGSVLEMVQSARLSALQESAVLNSIKSRTKTPVSALRAALAEITSRGMIGSPDEGLAIAKTVLNRFYADGAHLIRAMDKSYWTYTGTHWTRITDEQVFAKVLEVVQTVGSAKRKDYRALAESAARLLVGLTAADGDVLRLTEEPPPVINCRNGELWIDDDGSVNLRPHRADSYLTYSLDVDYNPAALCPRFDAALLGIFGNSGNPADMARHFNEIVGYLFQPRRDIACWVMLKGPGSNGKTKLIQTVEKLVSKLSIYAGRISDIEGNLPAIGSLAGKLILLDDDVDTGTKLPDGLLKKLSERKLLTGALKFRDHFEFVATCVPVVLANNFPLTSDLSYGMRRRAKIVPFDRTFTKADKDDSLFPHIFRYEMPGVLNRAIEGLQRLRARGDFEEPDACEAAKADWLAQANPLAGFVGERCEESPAAVVPMAAMYASFRAWAGDAGIRSIPSKAVVSSNLSGLGYLTKRTAAGMNIIGLRLLDAADSGFTPVLGTEELFAPVVH